MIIPAKLNNILQKIFSNRNGLILFLLLIPVLFISSSNFHDWGDDFAQYLIQTRNFVNGVNYCESPVLNYEEFCPFQRSAGFSLLLAPVYLLFGNSIQPLLIFLSICLVATGLVLFNVYKYELRNLSINFLTILMVLAFVYNHHVLVLKAEIVPLFAFSLILYACIRMVQINSNGAFAFLLLLSGFLMSVKVIGASFYVSLIVYYALVWFKSRERKIYIKYLLLIIGPLLIYLIIKKLVFGNVTMQNISWYSKVFGYESVVENVWANLLYYVRVFILLFEKEVWSWANVVLKVVVAISFLIGVVQRWIIKRDVINIFFVIYLLVLLNYRYQHAGIRFLLPVLPIILLYVFYGLNFLFFKVRFRKVLFATFFTLLLTSNAINIKQLIFKDVEIEGPQSSQSVEMFEMVKLVVPDNEIVAFIKPWALSYYTNCKTIYIKHNWTFDQIKVRMEKFKAQYLILDAEVEIIESTQLEIIWKNSKFQLLKYKVVLNE